MADSTIGKAYVQILPSMEGIAGQMTSMLGGPVQEAGKKAGAEMGEAMGGSLSSGLLSAVKGVGSKVAGLMKTALTGVVDMSKIFANNAAETAAYGDSIDKMSQKMGLSAKAYQEWDAVMQHSGTSMETMKASMKTLANAAENGNKAFEKLGITQKDLEKMSQEELFEATIKGLQELDDVTERTYLSGQLLGKGATELGALLNTSAEDTQAMRDRLHELGGVMSDEAVKASAAFQDNMQDLQTALAGAKRGIMSEFLPSINTLIDGFTRLIAGEEGAEQLITEGLGKFSKSFEQGLTKVIEGAAKFLESNGGIILGSMTKLAGNLAQTFAKALPSIVNAVKQVIPQIAAALGSIADTLIDVFPDLTDAFVQLVGEIAAVIPQLLPKIGEALMTALPALISGFTDILPILLETLTGIIEQTAQMIPEIIPPLFEAVVNAIPTIVQTIADNLPVIIQALTDVVMSIAEVIPTIIPVLMPALTQAVCALIQGIAKAAAVAPELISAVIDVAMAISDAMIDNLPLFIDCAVQILKASGKALLDNFPEFMESLGELFVKIIDIIEEAFPRFLEAGKRLWKHITDGIKNGWDGFVHEVYEWGDSVLEAVGGIWTDIKEFWGGLWDDMVEAGGDLIEGIVEGIKQKWEDLKESVLEFGETVIETFCDFFDINSPSKVMEDMIGKNLALGIDVGFVSNIDDVSKDMSGSLNRVLDEMDGAELNANISGGVTVPQVTDLQQTEAPTQKKTPATFVFQLNGREIAEASFEDMNELLGKTTTLQARGIAR